MLLPLGALPCGRRRDASSGTLEIDQFVKLLSTMAQRVEGGVLIFAIVTPDADVGHAAIVPEP